MLLEQRSIRRDRNKLDASYRRNICYSPNSNLNETDKIEVDSKKTKSKIRSNKDKLNEELEELREVNASYEEKNKVYSEVKHERNKSYIEELKEFLSEKDYISARELFVTLQKMNSQFEFYSINPQDYKVYCYFKVGDYCYKYDFGPVFCKPRDNEYGCSWYERKMPDSRIKYNEEVSLIDIKDEKRLTMFGEYYYDKDRFNKENYEDMLDFYEYIIKHFNDD